MSRQLSGVASPVHHAIRFTSQSPCFLIARQRQRRSSVCRR